MKRMLINATQPEEIRLAMVDRQRLLNFEIEQYGREQRKGNIYKAVITRIEPSLEACFVDYGEERQGFLPFKEISRQYFAPSETPIGQIKINEAVKVGQELIVQVEKEERGNKNAALTTFISLAGRYLVLMPNKPRSGGVSRRIEGEERQDLKEAMSQLKYSRGMSLIARTAGIGRAVNELQWDLDYLLGLWNAISEAAQAQEGAFLIYTESSLIIRAIRDYYSAEVSEILIDTESLYQQAQQFMACTMPDDVHKVKFYQDEAALFARFQIEKQIESAYAREVKLPSGGSIVLDHTEALVAVDVNSAKSTKGGAIEETATNTNLEAAEEIARQLRLRDLGGLIVIDFIDMEEPDNRLEVENRLRQAIKQDRARVQFSNISKFGLLELSRQRLRPALFEGASISCPRCNGTGHIRDTESTALQILRRIQEEAGKENTAAIKIQVPVDVTSYLLNKKREEITKIEHNNSINVVLIPNKQLETPNYNLERLKIDDTELETLQQTYVMTTEVDEADAVISKAEQKSNRQEPVIKSYLPKTAPAPQPEQENKKRQDSRNRNQKTEVETKETSSGGLWAWFKKLFSPAPVEEVPSTKKSSSDRRGRKNGNREDRRNNGRQNDRRRNDRDDLAEGSRDRNDRNRNKNDRNGDRKERHERNNGHDRQNDQRAESNGKNRNNNNEQQPRENKQRNNNRRNEEKNNAQLISQATELTESVNLEISSPKRNTRQNNNREESLPLTPETGTNQTASQIGDPENVQEQGNRNNRRGRKNQRTREQDDLFQHVPSEELSSTEEYAGSQTDQVIETDELQDGKDDEQSSRSRSRRTRDRYGRDRRQQRQPRDSNKVINSDDACETEQIAEYTTENEVLPSKHSDHHGSTISTQEQVRIVDMTVEESLEVTQIVQPVDSARQTTTEHVFETETKIVHTKTSTTQSYELPTQNLKEMAQQVGLQWVGTNPERVQEIQASIQNTPKPHLGREMKPSVTIVDEPLVLVETQKTIPSWSQAELEDKL